MEDTYTLKIVICSSAYTRYPGPFVFTCLASTQINLLNLNMHKINFVMLT